MWDVFISHAAEDKDSVARPLADALSRMGYRVWYDEFTLRLGDSLNRSINLGLAQSRYGLVILSPNFFAKEWPRRELDGLSVRETGTGKVILPVWHGVTQTQVTIFSPTLADRLGVDTALGLDHVVKAIAQVLQTSGGPVPPDGPPTVEAFVRPLPKPAWTRRGWLLGSGALVAAAALLGVWQVQQGRATAFAGRWVIDPIDQMPRTYLDLHVESGRLSGTVETLYPNYPDSVMTGLYAQRKTALTDGHLAPPHIAFVARRQYRSMLRADAPLQDLVIRYEGQMEGDTLHLAIQVEGGPHRDAVARRVREDGPSARLEQTLSGHESQITQLLLLDSTHLASASADETVRVWSLATGQEDLRLQHESWVLGIVPLSGRRLLGAGQDGDIQEWDLDTGKVVRRLQPLEHRLQALLPLTTDQLFTVWGWDEQQLVIYNLSSGQITRKLPITPRRTTHFALLRDGTLVGGDADGAIRLWPMDGAREARVVRSGRETSEHAVTGLHALPDGRLAYTIRKEPNAFLWDPITGREQPLSVRHSARWVDLIARVGDELAFLDDLDDLTLWHCITGQARQVLSIEREESALTALQILPDGRLALGMGDGPIKLWRLA